MSLIGDNKSYSCLLGDLGLIEDEIEDVLPSTTIEKKMQLVKTKNDIEAIEKSILLQKIELEKFKRKTYFRPDFTENSRNSLCCLESRIKEIDEIIERLKLLIETKFLEIILSENNNQGN